MLKIPLLTFGKRRPDDMQTHVTNNSKVGSLGGGGGGVISMTIHHPTASIFKSFLKHISCLHCALLNIHHSGYTVLFSC